MDDDANYSGARTCTCVCTRSDAVANRTEADNVSGDDDNNDDDEDDFESMTLMSTTTTTTKSSTTAARCQ
jgi:hypothetical protein